MYIVQHSIITKFKDKDLFLPNSVDLLNDGSIIICDGGNDRICLFNSNANPVKEFGKKGWFFNRFKEPVGAFVSNFETVFVMDWHNHRVVELDKNLKYLFEFGYFSNFNHKYQNLILLKKIILEIKFFFNIIFKIPLNGSYIDYHFKKRQNYSKKYLNLGEIIISYFGFFYSFYLNLINGVIFNYGINKPNGIAFSKDYLIITQKKNRCLSIHQNKKPYKRLFNIFTQYPIDSFGRLGNVFSGNNKFFICDESKNYIIVFNHDLKYVRRIDGKDVFINDFTPFSCCLVSNSILAIISKNIFIFFDFIKNEVLFKSDVLGELHGIAFNIQTNMLYVCNRSKHCVHTFIIHNNKK